MGEITILAKSSSKKGVHYSVNFLFDEDRLFVSCDCPAGRFRKFCKHKLAFIRGNDSYLYDEGQRDDLNKVADWVQKSGYLDYIIRISKAQRMLEEAEANLKKIHEELAQAFTRGVRKIAPK